MFRVARILTVLAVAWAMMAGSLVAVGNDGSSHLRVHSQRGERVGPIQPVSTKSGAVSPATSSIDFVSGTWWIDSYGYLIVAGEVHNGMATRQEYVEIGVTIENAVGDVVGSFSTYADIDQIAPGMTSSFWGLDTAPPDADSVWISVGQGYAVTDRPQGVLDVELGVPYTDGYGYRHYPGTVRNRASFSVEFAQVTLTFYDDVGDVADADWSYADPDTIAAGGSSPFEIMLPDPGASSIGIVAQARSEADFSVYATSWNNYFDDLGASTFRSDIIWLADSGITTGCSAGLFCPNDSVTRGQMAAFLDRALHLPGTTTDYFTDDNGTTFEGNINRLAAAGITSGCGPGLFCPTATVKRDQMASFLARAFNLPATATDYFSDDTGNTHEGNINRLAASGITKGCSPTTYCPKAEVTRGQMAAFLHRALLKYPVTAAAAGTTGTGAEATPEPSPTPSATPEPLPTASVSPAPSTTPELSASPSPTATASPSVSPSPTLEASRSPSVAIDPGASPSPSAEPSVSPLVDSTPGPT